MQFSRVHLYELDLSAPEDQRGFRLCAYMLFTFEIFAIPFYGDRIFVMGGQASPLTDDDEDLHLCFSAWDYEKGECASWLWSVEEFSSYKEVRGSSLSLVASDSEC